MTSFLNNLRLSRNTLTKPDQICPSIVLGLHVAGIGTFMSTTLYTSSSFSSCQQGTAANTHVTPQPHSASSYCDRLLCTIVAYALKTFMPENPRPQESKSLQACLRQPNIPPQAVCSLQLAPALGTSRYESSGRSKAIAVAAVVVVVAAESIELVRHSSPTQERSAKSKASCTGWMDLEASRKTAAQ